MPGLKPAIIGACALLLCAGCSMRRMATRSFADALAGGAGASFAHESDLEIVKGALPFSLKAMEALLEHEPRHRSLLLSLAQGYMLYAYAFVDMEADEIKATDAAAYQHAKARARNLYYRAFDYARRGLAAGSQQIESAFASGDLDAALRAAARADAPFLYWAGAGLAKWIALAKTEPAAAVRLPEAAAYMQRALALDPDFDRGAIHEFFIAYEARGSAAGGDMAAAREHFQRALALSEGKKLSPLLAYIEACAVPGQNRAEFNDLTRQIREFDVDRFPEYRLVNTIAKKRAAYLVRIQNDLFLGD